MAIAEGQWTIVHGDSSRSPVFAICSAKGDPIDLEANWVVRAQARATLDSYDLIFGWSAGHGLEISTGRVKLSNGRKITTATVGLSLLPGDFQGLPRDWSGIVEIEVASDSTSSPAQRYTVARLATRIVPDVTRDEGTLIVSPGIPAPSAPAGGVLAGSYPNPIFAVPMMTKAEIENAIADASTLDRQRGNHLGTQSADTLTDGAIKRAFLATERTKLAGIADNATANATDVQLRDRATHTGSMSAAGISDFAETVQDVMGGSFVEGLNISISYNDANGTFTIAAANQGGQGGGAQSGGGVSGVRVANGNTQAFTNELLKVDASGGPVTINPPPSPPTGTQVTLVKIDSSSNHVTWNAPTSGASTYDIATRWSGGTLTYDGTSWIATGISNAALTFADITGQVPDSAIPSLIARDQEVADAIAASSINDRARPNHTGTQPISTVSGLQVALDSRGPLLTQVATKTASYAAAAYEAVPLDTTSGGSITLTFPTNAPIGTQIGARWIAGTASPLISAPAGELIGAAQVQTMNLAPSTTSGEYIVWQKWTSTVWLPAGGFKPQAALQVAFDSRYLLTETPGSTAFRAHNSTAQPFASNADTIVSFPTVSRSSSLVTPSTEGAGHKYTLNRAGLWVGNTTVRLLGGTSGEVYVAAVHVGVGIIAAFNAAYANNASATRHLSISGFFNVGASIYISVFQSSGSSKNSDPNAGNWCQINLGWVHP